MTASPSQLGTTEASSRMTPLQANAAVHLVIRCAHIMFAQDVAKVDLDRKLLWLLVGSSVESFLWVDPLNIGTSGKELKPPNVMSRRQD